MKRLIKTLCIAIAVLLALNVPVYAEEASARSSAYIAAYNSSIYRGDGAEMHIWYEVIGTNTMDEIGVSEIKVQKSATGTGDWTTVKTFRKSDYPQQMVSQDSFFHNSHVTYYGLSGNYYRAIVTVYAAKDNGSGYIFDYTQVLYLSPL